MTPKLLLIRPKIDTDDFTKNFSYPASDLGTKAVNLGWDVTILELNDTNRANVENTIRNGNFDFIIQYGHGESDKLFGQRDNVQESIIDTANADMLSWALVSTVSCSSAIGLGPKAVEKNTARNKSAYLGHNLPYGCEYPHWEFFQKAANEANIALLEGKTFMQAKARGYAEYTNQINNLLNSPPSLTKYIAAALLWIDRESLTVVGKRSARAKP